MRMPKKYLLQRELEVSIEQTTQIIMIPSKALSTGDEDVGAILHQFESISLNVNEFPMHIVTRLKNMEIHEIQDREVIVHDQLVNSREQIEQEEEEINWMKIEQEMMVNEKTKVVDDMQQS